MAQVTNQQLQDSLQKLTIRVDKIEERMGTYEDQTKEHTVILKRIETTVNGYERGIGILTTLSKYVLGTLSIAIACFLAYWVMILLHIIP